MVFNKILKKTRRGGLRQRSLGQVFFQQAVKMFGKAIFRLKAMPGTCKIKFSEWTRLMYTRSQERAYSFWRLLSKRQKKITDYFMIKSEPNEP